MSQSDETQLEQEPQQPPTKTSEPLGPREPRVDEPPPEPDPDDTADEGVSFNEPLGPREP